MIELRIAEAARRRGIENPKQLADLMKSNPAPIWKVWTGKVDPKLSMLDRICEALDCEPSELIVRIPSKKAKKSPARQSGSKKRAKSKEKPKR